MKQKHDDVRPTERNNSGQSALWTGLENIVIFSKISKISDNLDIFDIFDIYPIYFFFVRHVIKLKNSTYYTIII